MIVLFSTCNRWTTPLITSLTTTSSTSREVNFRPMVRPRLLVCLTACFGSMWKAPSTGPAMPRATLTSFRAWLTRATEEVSLWVRHLSLQNDVSVQFTYIVVTYFQASTPATASGLPSWATLLSSATCLCGTLTTTTTLLSMIGTPSADGPDPTSSSTLAMWASALPASTLTTIKRSMQW